MKNKNELKKNEKKYKVRTESDTKSDFIALTPVLLKKEEMAGYNEALDFAFSETNSNIRNIALTGNYGTGKTSVWNTYENENKTLRTAKISFLDFNNNEEKTLEYKITNQLVYQLSGKSIRKSNFDIHLTRLTIANIISCILFLGTIYTVTNVFFAEELQRKKLFLVLSLFIGLIFYFVNFVFSNHSFNIKSLTVGKTRIELDKDYKNDYFEKHYEDIINLISQSGKNVLVIEDLDRFDDVNIFIKLRDLNAMINNKICHKRKFKPIKFVYMVKDDLFQKKKIKDFENNTYLKEDGSRTKFFDFIIPIIPVITSANSYNQLKDVLSKEDLDTTTMDQVSDKIIDRKKIDYLSTKFLMKISLYLDDKRILNNICNEYHVIKEKISRKNRKLSCENLFSIVVYKNYFPKDYIDTCNNEGLISFIFNNIDKFTEEYLSDKLSSLEIIKERLDFVEKSNLESISEILSSKLNIQLISVKTGNKPRISGRLIILQYIYKIYSEGDFSITSTTKVNYYENGNSTYIDFEKFINTFISDELLKKVSEFPNEYTEDTIKKYKVDIKKIENEIKTIKDYSLSEILKNNDLCYIIDILIKKETTNTKKAEDYLVEINNSKKINSLLSMLLSNGYINEMYKEYLIYVDESILTYNDNLFVTKTTSQNNFEEFSYNVDNINGVLEFFEPYEYSKKGFVNFSILDFLYSDINANNYLRNKNLLQKIRKNIYDFDFVNFVLEYYSKNKNHGLRLFLELVSENNDFFNEILDFTHEFEGKENLIFDIISYKKVKSWNLVNTNYDLICRKYNDFFDTFINNSSDLLYKVVELGIINKKLPVHLICLDYFPENINNNQIKFIASSNKFHISFDNIKRIFYAYSNTNFSDYPLNSLNSLKKVNELCYKYFINNINDYISSCILFNNNKCLDSKINIMEALKLFDDDTTSLYLEKCNINELEFEDVSEKFYAVLVDNSTFRRNYFNLKWLHSTVEQKDLENLYLSKFSKDDFNEILEEDIEVNKFVVLCEQVDIEVKEEFIKNIDTNFTSLFTKDLAVINLFIKYKKIDFTEETYKEVLGICEKKNVVEFIFNNWILFLNLLEEENKVITKLNEKNSHIYYYNRPKVQTSSIINNELCTKIFLSEYITPNKLMQIIPYVDFSIDISLFKTKSDIFNCLISYKNSHLIKDIPNLIKTCESDSNALAICEIFADNKDIFISKNANISYILLKALISNTEISLDYKDLFIENAINDQTINSSKDLFDLMLCSPMYSDKNYNFNAFQNNNQNSITIINRKYTNSIVNYLIEEQYISKRKKSIDFSNDKLVLYKK